MKLFASPFKGSYVTKKKKGSGAERGPRKPKASRPGKALAKYADRMGPPVAIDPHAEREAQRYDQPIPSREAILALLEDRGELLMAEDIARALRLFTDYEINALGKRLGCNDRDHEYETFYDRADRPWHGKCCCAMTEMHDGLL